MPGDGARVDNTSSDDGRINADRGKLRGGAAVWISINHDHVRQFPGREAALFVLFMARIRAVSDRDPQGFVERDALRRVDRIVGQKAEPQERRRRMNRQIRANRNCASGIDEVTVALDPSMTLLAEAALEDAIGLTP